MKLRGNEIIVEIGESFIRHCEANNIVIVYNCHQFQALLSIFLSHPSYLTVFSCSPILSFQTTAHANYSILELYISTQICYYIPFLFILMALIFAIGI